MKNKQNLWVFLGLALAIQSVNAVDVISPEEIKDGLFKIEEQVDEQSEVVSYETTVPGYLRESQYKQEHWNRAKYEHLRDVIAEAKKDEKWVIFDPFNHFGSKVASEADLALALAFAKTKESYRDWLAKEVKLQESLRDKQREINKLTNEVQRLTNEIWRLKEKPQR